MTIDHRVLLSVVFAGAVAACSSESPEAPGPGAAPLAPTSTATATPTAPPPAGAAGGSQLSGGGGFFTPPPAVDAGPETCDSIAVQSESITIEIPVEVTEEIPYEVTEEVPKAIYVMLDSSQSMVTETPQLDDLWLLLCLIPGFCPAPDPNAAPPSKWDFARAGITQFLDDPGSAALKVGINYFPQGGQCDGSGYDMPAVPVAPLTENAQAIKDNMAATVPANFTPTAGALRGLIAFCDQYQLDHPNEKCVGVLITDGAPTECDPQDGGGLAALAADAATRDIQIFAAGMVGADFRILHAIGQAGGADCTPNDPATWACDMTADADAFLKALQEIASQTVTRTRTETRTEIRTEIQVQPVECEWGVPAPPEGEEFDPEKINVRVTEAGAQRNIGKVPAEAECANFQGGWYFDDPVAPTRVSVCPETCASLQNVQDQVVEVLFGCKSEPAVAR